MPTRPKGAIELTATSTPTEQLPEKLGIGRKIRAYVALTKPRVMELLLVTTVPVMFLAAHGMPDLWLVITTVIGGAMSAGSAAAFNMYIDRDMDAHMKRTKNRPLVTGELTPRNALVFAWVMAVLSTVWLAVFTNWVATLYSVVAIFFYVVIYTLWLKRRTEQNIIWGGIAGCFPVVIGWTAVDPTFSWAPVILFIVVFLWTPAHYWPLSMKYKDQYGAVSVPMLGVTRGTTQVGLQVILYTWATVICSLLLIAAGPMHAIYTVSALVSGGWFVYEAHRLYNQAVKGTKAPAPMRVFHASITYCTILFLAIALDALFPIAF